MPSSLYVVIESREKWYVDLEGKAHGPYASKEQATEEGRNLARFAAHMGKHTEVLVPNAAGRWVVVFDSAKEPHAVVGRSNAA